MIYVKGVPYIKIDLDPGIYRFCNYSATGKTYLGYIMMKYQAKQPFAVYSYNDYARRKTIESTILDSDRLLLLDRYDMYGKEEDDKVIQSFADRGGIVLIDAKQVENIYSDYEFCQIRLNSDGIEVFR